MCVIYLLLCLVRNELTLSAEDFIALKVSGFISHYQGRDLLPFLVIELILHPCTDIRLKCQELLFYLRQNVHKTSGL